MVSVVGLVVAVLVASMLPLITHNIFARFYSLVHATWESFGTGSGVAVSVTAVEAVVAVIALVSSSITGSSR